MDYKSILIGSVIYFALAVLIGYFVSSLAIYAAAIAALLAGIYIARLGVSPMKGAFYGLLVGLIGGIIGGIISVYIPSLGGVPLSVAIGAPFTILVGLVASTVPWFAVPALAIVGMIFGAIGGWVGKRYLKR